MLAKHTLWIATDRALYLDADRPPGGWRRLGAMSLVMGLSGRFGLRVGEAPAITCHSALIGVDVRHRIDPHGETVAVLYLEPDAREARALIALLQQHGGVVLDAAKALGSGAHLDCHLRSFDVASLLGCGLVARAPLDGRVAACLQQLRVPREAFLRRCFAATGVSLSVSRLNHLFQKEMGVSFRRYRAWSQLLEGAKAKTPSVSLTQLAAIGGFADLAHFSRTYRDAFGVMPSRALGTMAVHAV